MDFIYIFINKNTAIVFTCSLTEVINSLRKKEQSYYGLGLTYHVLFSLRFPEMFVVWADSTRCACTSGACHCSPSFWWCSHDWGFCFMTKPAHFVVLPSHCYEVIMRWLNISRVGLIAAIIVFWFPKSVADIYSRVEAGVRQHSNMQLSSVSCCTLTKRPYSWIQADICANLWSGNTVYLHTTSIS